MSLADTVGYANPAAVSHLFEGALRIAGERIAGAHFHDTRGLALANVCAALQLGIERFDASLAGIGGCPHAPGASGNVASEDLVFMLASMGFLTGIDPARLLQLRQAVVGWIPGEETHGSVWRAGLPKDFTVPEPAAGSAAAPVHPRPSPGAALPLDGVRVLELSHMVMGPTCGMILADLGAEVIKVEPPGGDKTRWLPGLGQGFFRTFNRNKKSIVLDLRHGEGVGQLKQLLATSDVLIENFRPGYLRDLGLDYASLAGAFPRLIYVSHKGFLPGPYEKRVALDEVVQMMGGLAYMTGPAGRPLRAGASVNDIMGGMFGAIGVLAALRARDATGRGQEVQSALFENCAFLCAQHVQQYLMSGEPPAPMPARVSAWGVYDVFTTAGGEQLFIGATSDRHFRALCAILGREDLGADPALEGNSKRVNERPRLLAELQRTLKDFDAERLVQALEAAEVPYARIVRPDQLLDDPHLKRSGALAPMITEEGTTTQVLLLPLLLGGQRLGVRCALARTGEHTASVLAGLRRGAEGADG